ncbi:hypothetical protein DPEC_G00017560 [Dallia pectoralis]|uniref:Uncharacterized protein n=1 Tax=Dallia pectoralis TaxID=75939 RepID=A0ACC2HF46_DALPE|nr:hypothetical protein DPEC_G00017560 [Dallia pectoralis]
MEKSLDQKQSVLDHLYEFLIAKQVTPCSGGGKTLAASRHWLHWPGGFSLLPLHLSLVRGYLALWGPSIKIGGAL